jgi:hypothetical protein
MTPKDHPTGELLRELAEAKVWPDQFRARLEKGQDIGKEVAEADEKIEALEKRARRAIRELGNEFGCGHPRTRMVFQGMADMLIHWYDFRDSL